MPGLAYSGVMSGMGFWRTQQTLAITTATQTVSAGVCSGVTTVRTKNGAGAFANVTSNLTVNLAATGGITFYSDANCSTQITSVTITTGNSSANFYFLPPNFTTYTITATALTYAAATQTETGVINAYVWTGNGANALWSNGANWSGGAAPGASNQALFNGTCSSNCSPTISANINVGGIRIASGYTSTITQSSGVTITTVSAGWYQAAGTFAGSDSTITIGGPFGLAGGTFTSTSGTLAAGNEFTVFNSPTFNHNNGKVTFNNSNIPSISGVGSINFYNVDFLGQGSFAWSVLNGNMNVLGSLTFVDYGYGAALQGTGTINVSKDLQTQGTQWFVQSGIKIKMIGTGTITGGSGASFGALEIATAGTITFASTGVIALKGDFTYTSGTVVTTGSTVRLIGGTQTITPGSMSFNHFAIYDSGVGYANITINGTMTVLGDLSLACLDYNATLNSGTINVSGNLNITNGQFSGGSALIRMVGTGTITGSGAGSFTPNLEIATSGTITFANTGSADIGGNFTYTSGTVITTGSTVRFVGNNGLNINSGSMIFNNLTFSQGSMSANTITGTMYVNGNLNFNGTQYWPANNGGSIEVKGNLSTTGYPFAGTTSLVLTGSGVQTMTGNTSGRTFPGSTITVNNASSVLTLGSNNVLGASQGITVTAGSVNMAGYALTTKSLSLNGNTLTKNSGTLTVNGTVVGTGSLYGGTVNP